MLLPAPGRFSITKGWPSASPSLAPTSRAITSTPEPAVRPTITLTGRSGYPAAVAAGAAAMLTAASAADRIRFISSSTFLVSAHVGSLRRRSVVHEQAAVHVNGLSGDEAALGAAQHQHGSDNLVRLGEAAHWDAFHVEGEGRRAYRIGRPRRHAVDVDVVRGELGGERTRQAGKARFRRRGRGAVGDWHMTHQPAHID